MSSSLRYNPALDGMRAIAALLVVADHYRMPGSNGAFYGVDMFFVLSGYLITRLLFAEHAASGSIALTRFYLRRYLRLTPSLLALLGAYVVFGPILWPQFSVWWHWRDAALSALYVSDYGRAFWNMPHIVQHTWSLGVEEHFYLIWPFAVIGLLRLPPRWRPAALFALYVAATAWRMNWYDDATDWPETYFRFDTRMSGLVLGALLATVLSKVEHMPERLANLSGVVATGALVLALMIGGWRFEGAMEWTMTLAEFAAAALLIAASAPESWVSRLLSAPPIAAVGVLSYGIYLWHYPAAVYFRGMLPWFETVPVVLAIAFVGAAMNHLLIERPLQAYRRGLKPASSEDGIIDAQAVPAALSSS
ncbi:MAG: acyltransferase family protein [Pseudolabrys sp.]